MLVSEVIDALKYGELDKHGIFIDGTPSEKDTERLIHQINLGLSELYSRFPFACREFTLFPIEGKVTYEISNEYILGPEDSPSWNKYIECDSDAMYVDDLLVITDVFDEVGNVIPINDSTAEKVVTTPSPNIMEIPSAIEGDVLFVLYKSKHKKLTSVNDKVKLPSNWLPALLSYVAQRIYSGGTAPEHINQANMLMQKYEMYCSQQSGWGLDNSLDNTKNSKAYLGGWV